MDTGLIATRYARALFLFAKDREQLQLVFEEVRQLLTSYETQPRLRSTLNAPMLTHQDKYELLLAAIGKQVSEVMQHFVKLVLHHRRDAFLQNMAYQFVDMYKTECGVSIGKLITAVPVPEAMQQKIKDMVGTYTRFKDVEFETIVNPKILGGFVLYLDTYRLDASLSRQLQNLEHQMVERSRKIV